MRRTGCLLRPWRLSRNVDLDADLAGLARRRAHARACRVDIAERLAVMAAVLVLRQRLHRLLARGVKACRRHSGNGHDTISSDTGVSLVAPNQWCTFMVKERLAV